jgi:spermidine synthase
LARIDCLRINHPMDVLPFITYQGIRVTVDRISSAEEVAFLEPIASDMKPVFEIGAGYGRTAEAMLGFYPDMERYTIVDLASVIKLARQYLLKVCARDVRISA